MNFVHLLTTIAEHVLDDEVKKTVFEAVLDTYDVYDEDDYDNLYNFLNIDTTLDELLVDRYDLEVDNEDI